MISRRNRARLARSKRPVSYSADEQKSTIVTPMSNYEGFKRLEAAFERNETRARKGWQTCDVCLKSTPASRIVPCLDGTRKFRGMIGWFKMCCDDGPESCAQKLVRAGQDVIAANIATEANHG